MLNDCIVKIAILFLHLEVVGIQEEKEDICYYGCDEVNIGSIGLRIGCIHRTKCGYDCHHPAFHTEGVGVHPGNDTLDEGKVLTVVFRILTCGHKVVMLIFDTYSESIVTINVLLFMSGITFLKQALNAVLK